MKEKNDQLSVTKEESLKNQLKSADEKQLVELIAVVTEELKNGRYRKVGVQRAVVAVLCQRRNPPGLPNLRLLCRQRRFQKSGSDEEAQKLRQGQQPEPLNQNV